MEDKEDYKVLARKYRPLRFQDVVGQPHVTTLLQNAVRLGRISHAYMFSGPRGTGKTTTARLLAMALNCERSDKPTPDPCGECDSCAEIKTSRSLDVQEIDGASNSRVDDIRELRGTINYVSSRDRWKVYIIDEVHMLSNSAFNALLKTLEEPPKQVVFVFATTELHKVPATILSRCQLYEFHRININETIKQLDAIAGKEAIAVEPECLKLLARKADGSMRDAISLLDQLHSAAVGTLTVAQARKFLGLLPDETYRALCEHLRRGEGREALTLASKALDEGADIEELITGFTEYLKTMLLSGLVDLESSGVKEASSAQDLLRMIGVMVELARDAKWSTQPRTLLEVALIRLARMDDSVSLAQVLEGLGRLGMPLKPKDAEPPPKKQPEAGEKKPGAPSEPAPAHKGQGNLDLAAVELGWEGVVASLQKQFMIAGSCLASGRPVGCRDGMIEIAFAKNDAFSKEQVESRHKAAVEKTLSEFFNAALRIRCTLAPDPPKQEEEKPPRDRKAALAGGEDAAGVRRIVEAFGGEII